MLRLPQFGVETPKTIEEAVALLQQGNARIVAGGTDLIPNLKHRLATPSVLVNLSGLSELSRIEVGGDSLVIGAMATLTDVASSQSVRKYAPGLAKAASLVASPNIRNMATLGGNIHLDTRCRYVNQTAFWRSAIGGCLKSEGDVCHVVKGGKNCVAAMSSDCVPMLTALDAVVVLHSARGGRRVPLREYYNTNGVDHVNKEADELMTEVVVPLVAGDRRSVYAKWTVRENIDFPLISIALVFDVSGGKVANATACVGVLNARPKLIDLSAALRGKALDDNTLATVAGEIVGKKCTPLGNVPYDADYRKQMISVYTRRAVAKLGA